MNARKLAVSLAAASALAAALPSMAQDVVIVAPEPVYSVPVPSTGLVVTSPETTVTRETTYIDQYGRRFEVTEMLTNEMTEQERRDAAGQRDYATGIITAPGYMGPRDAKGQ